MKNSTTSTEAQNSNISEFARELEMVVSVAILDLDIAAGRVAPPA